MVKKNIILEKKSSEEFLVSLACEPQHDSYLDTSYILSFLSLGILMKRILIKNLNVFMKTIYLSQ